MKLFETVSLLPNYFKKEEAKCLLFFGTPEERDSKGRHQCAHWCKN